MDEKKMRTIPPLIVSAIAVAALFVAAVVTISNQTALEAGANDSVTEIVEEVTVQQSETQTVTAQAIETEEESTYETLIKSRDWGAEDSTMLLKISMAEAEGEGVEGKALAMLVVLNRVWSEDFPDTIEEVIFQPGQFSVVKDGGRYYTTEPDEECYEALELVATGWDESEGALYFESCTGGSWHSSNLELLYEVGNHRFYK